MMPLGFVNSVKDSLRLEVIVPCVGFEDLLRETLPLNLPHVDRLTVVTSHEDAATAAVARSCGAEVLQTDQFRGTFARGAGISAAFPHFRHQGWRLVLDADIALPSHFRRVLLNHEYLDPACLYGADRMDVILPVDGSPRSWTQWGEMDEVRPERLLRPRLFTRSHGYLPLGYFQLWNAASHKPYPQTAGGGGLDDVAFAQQWPGAYRRLLPSTFVYHLCVATPSWGENWDGIRRHPRQETV